MHGAGERTVPGQDRPAPRTAVALFVLAPSVRTDNRFMLRTTLPLLLLAGCTGFHAEARDVYRSPQVQEDQLVRRIERHGIRSVVCLRGGRPARMTERATESADATFYNVSMSARRAPPPDKLLQLWRIAERAERPLLVHCRAGVDRTGLAMAIITLHDTGDLDEARGQLALVPYGHVGAMGTEAMDEVLDAFAPFAGTMSFPDWVENVYGPDWHAQNDPR